MSQRKKEKKRMKILEFLMIYLLLKQRKITTFELPFSSKLQIQIFQPFNSEFLEPIEDEFNS